MKSLRGAHFLHLACQGGSARPCPLVSYATAGEAYQNAIMKTKLLIWVPVNGWHPQCFSWNGKRLVPFHACFSFLTTEKCVWKVVERKREVQLQHTESGLVTESTLDRKILAQLVQHLLYLQETFSLFAGAKWTDSVFAKVTQCSGKDKPSLRGKKFSGGLCSSTAKVRFRVFSCSLSR